MLVAHERTVNWLRRVDFFLVVMLHLYAGLFLFFIPWTHLWIYNRFFLYYAGVAHVTQNGALRGVISGLGLLNLWFAIADAIHYRDR